jgi:hypothetical protein
MSVTALLVLAAEEAEPSKAAFYIGGGVLAVWAVVLSVIGLSRPNFPGSKGAARGIYAISTLLVALAAATSILTG